MVLFEIHQRFKGHLLNKLCLSFKDESESDITPVYKKKYSTLVKNYWSVSVVSVSRIANCWKKSVSMFWNGIWKSLRPFWKGHQVSKSLIKRKIKFYLFWVTGANFFIWACWSKIKKIYIVLVLLTCCQ